jgi:8-oxo-dGTP diphosphatase
VRIENIDWTRWTPREEATLLYVVRDGQILLIHKKRGIGAGKVNGAGGRIMSGESPLEAAVRELEEEVRVTPHGATKRGEVLFQMTNGTSIRIHVFAAGDCDGEPRETDEATPFWAPLERIPYDRMWADDQYWLPLMLQGARFEVRTLFDDDVLLGHEMVVKPEGFEWG